MNVIEDMYHWVSYTGVLEIWNVDGLGYGMEGDEDGHQRTSCTGGTAPDTYFKCAMSNGLCQKTDGIQSGHQRVQYLGTTLTATMANC